MLQGVWTIPHDVDKSRTLLLIDVVPTQLKPKNAEAQEHTRLLSFIAFTLLRYYSYATEARVN